MKFSGLVDVNNFDPNQFFLDLSNEEITVYSAVVYSKAFQMDINLAIAIFYKNGTEKGRKFYYSTDINQTGEKIVGYYQARFQIEFLYRDAKQHTDLTFCQVRGKNKVDFHFNAALTAGNLAKHDWLYSRGNKDKPSSMSDYKKQYNCSLILERFMCVFAINPNMPKNQKIFKELLISSRIAL